MNNAIRKIRPAGVVITVVGTEGRSATIPGPLPARLFRPIGVAFEPRTGKLFITVEDAVLEATFSSASSSDVARGDRRQGEG